MNTLNINELWSIFLLHFFLNGILKAFKEKLSQSYPGKYLFLITALGNCYIRRIYAKTISESMLGKVARFCPGLVCKCYFSLLSDYHFFFIGSSDSCPFHCLVWLPLTACRLQRGAWGYWAAWKCFGAASGPASAEVSDSTSQQLGKGFAKDPYMHTRFLHISVDVKCGSACSWDVVVGVQI